MDEADEVLDLFDADEKLIGTIRRGEIRALQPGAGRYIRAVNVFIQRSDGAIWVPTRSLHKSIAPGGLDYSTGGHLEHGEDYVSCLLRELKEEASLTCREEDVQLIHCSRPADDNSVYFMRLYLLTTDQPPHLSDEHTSGEWQNVAELIARIKAGVPAKKSLFPSAILLMDYLARQS